MIKFCNDLHLDFLTDKQLDSFFEEVNKEDFIIIAGDICEAYSFSRYAKRFTTQVYFVYGNHDFYKSSFQNVLNLMKPKNFHMLDNHPVDMGDYMLMGKNLWYDLKAGDFKNSDVWLNDFKLIWEFMNKTKSEIKEIINKMVNFGISELREEIKSCKHDKIVIVCHYPPFPEVSMYRGEQSDSDHLPFYCCKSLGDLLLEFPDKEFTCLSGHAHYACQKQIKNVNAIVGEGDYEKPFINEVEI